MTDQLPKLKVKLFAKLSYTGYDIFAREDVVMNQRVFV